MQTDAAQSEDLATTAPTGYCLPLSCRNGAISSLLVSVPVRGGDGDCIAVCCCRWLSCAIAVGGLSYMETSQRRRVAANAHTDGEQYRALRRMEPEPELELELEQVIDNGVRDCAEACSKRLAELRAQLSAAVATAEARQRSGEQRAEQLKAAHARIARRLLAVDNPVQVCSPRLQARPRVRRKGRISARSRRPT